MLARARPRHRRHDAKGCTPAQLALAGTLARAEVSSVVLGARTPEETAVIMERTGNHPFKVNQMFDMVSVTGRLRTERARNDLASASYVIEATHVEVHKP